MKRTVTDLEHYLAEPTPSALSKGPDLNRIHRLGARRRRARRAAVALASFLAVAVVVGVGYSVHLGAGGKGQKGLAPAGQSRKPAHTELSPIAKRVLREIPGAVQVSPWQVVIPGPGLPEMGEQKVADAEIAAGPLPLGGHGYTGVTALPRSAFPRWLYAAVQRIEQKHSTLSGAFPVGSTDMGVLVEHGEAELGCLARTHKSEPPLPGPCYPVLLTNLNGTRYLQWTMGTDHFLTKGAKMEVFLTEDYSRRAPGTIAIAGIDGTDVVRAEFITTAGQRVAGTVEAGTLVPHDSIFYANVPGELARVVAYAADGGIIEDHPIRPCKSHANCEVR